jgi:type IV secretion system protein VirB10
MRFLVPSLLLFGILGFAQSDSGLAGSWRYNPSRSQLRDLPSPPDAFLNVQESRASLTVSASAQENGPSTVAIYPLDGRTETRKVGESKLSTVTKWEGSSALLVNTIVSGPQNYTVMEQWRPSRDGTTLTIKRTIVRVSGETESVLVYENPTLISSVKPAEQPSRSVETISPARNAPTLVVPGRPVATLRQAPPPEADEEYVVEAGTRVLLRLTNSVNTRRTAVGDRVYLETVVPIFVHGRPVIPRGSYVIGTVTESKGAGRVKGKSSLNVQFDSITLSNGVTRDLRSRLGSVDTRGNLDRSEGKIEGEGNKGGDARTVGETTAAGTGIGAVAGAAGGHLGMGAGIGAAAGAAAGLAGVLGSRGPEVVLPAGTTMELVFDRDLRFTESELGRVR